jgi:hypothetical protein
MNMALFNEDRYKALPDFADIAGTIAMIFPIFINLLIPLRNNHANLLSA